MTLKIFKLFTGAVTLKILIFSLYRLKYYQKSKSQMQQRNFIIEHLKKSDFEVNSKYQENLTYLCKIHVKNQENSNLLTFLSQENLKYKQIDFKIKKITTFNPNSSIFYNFMGYDYDNCYYEIHINMNNCMMQMIEPNEFVMKLLDLFDIEENFDINMTATQQYQNHFARL